ncbi:integrase core domain-containing protein [Nocardioides marmotae]|uniref:integrase core domain-containing protein n=1 Tax=Nocardioides marmotae TaxID=2663857 RepID=UPI0012B66EFA|nr:transposase [Nocardioides marmotae]MTB84664.1 transposase [Nocardioides marmotae]
MTWPGWCTTPTRAVWAVHLVRVHQPAHRRGRGPLGGFRWAANAYDNALAESQIGIYKTEPIRPEGPWRGVEHVELETLAWVDWFDTERPYESIDDLTPIQAGNVHYGARKCLVPTG